MMTDRAWEAFILARSSSEAGLPLRTTRRVLCRSMPCSRMLSWTSLGVMAPKITIAGLRRLRLASTSSRTMAGTLGL